MNDIKPSGEICCFNSLIRLTGLINEHWKRRWGTDSPGHCFRGAGSELYDLNPGLLRPPYPVNHSELGLFENNLWVDFRLRSKALLGYQVRNAWEALVIMQQHGFPTRLLDWTRSLAVAAYFAARDDKYDNTDGAVWLMASKHLMELRGVPNGRHTVVGDPSLELLAVRDDKNKNDNFTSITPAPLLPDFLSPRMIAQRCLYTLHTFERDALVKLAHEDRRKHGMGMFLHKIIVPKDAKEGLRQSLPMLAGVSEETLFPDLDGFARDFVQDSKRSWRDRVNDPPAVN